MSISFYPTNTNLDGLNVSNANGMSILNALGIEPDYCGSIDPSDLKGRCLEALVLADDSGFPSQTTIGANGATMVDCGRREGYLADRLQTLIEVADQAISLGTDVTWA